MAGKARELIRRTVGKKRKSGKKAEPKLSRLRPPPGMSLETWQRKLREEFGREQKYTLRNLGDQPIFSEFEVVNPQSKNAYRVAIRGTRPGDNYCSCPDFGTNGLGTCKHIAFTLAKLEQKSGGKRALAEGFQPEYSEVFLHYGLEREIRFRPGTACPVELARLAGRYFDDEGKLKDDAFARFDAFVAKAGEAEHELRIYEDALNFVAQRRDAEHRAERIGKAFPRGIKSAAFKNLLRVPLYDYQREGALFAAKAGRTLIGDEMGLGKTAQAIAAAEIMARELGVERVLVVAPTSLKHHWEREIARFTNRTAQVIGGLRPAREIAFAEPSFFKILNYDTVHRDLDLIHHWSPDLVILDEAQRIKNWSTRVAKSVKQIASPYAIVLTGTPLENRLEELVSIVQFVDRHRLGPTYRFLHDHQIQEEGTGRVVGYQNLDSVGQTLAPILIRRRKDEVLKQLPKRLEKNFFVPMTPEQMNHHDENRDIVARIVHKWRRFGFLSEADQRGLMIALQNMRMSCNSTFLLDKVTDFGVKADELATLLDEIYEQPESKVVVFSQWTRTHELIQRRFAKRKWRHVLFHGGVPGQQRRGLIDRFKDEADCRAFLSTDAGGVGLNLQHAHVVVNMDLPWNPAVLEQRIGRVHRLGQQRPVQVVNFVSQGTIEEGMLSVLRFKKSLFAGVLDGGENRVFLGGSRLKQFLDTVENVTNKIPTAVAEERDAQERDAQPREAAANGSDAGGNGKKGAAKGSSAEGSEAGSGDAAETTADTGFAAAGLSSVTDPLSGLLRSGLALLEQFVQHVSPPSGGNGRDKSAAKELARPSAGLPVEVSRDAATGHSFVKLPLPAPELLQQFLDGLQNLLRK